jgi:hypothetical protein
MEINSMLIKIDKVLSTLYLGKAESSKVGMRDLQP